MKIKKGNFFFVSFKGDHKPKHVHIYKDGRTIAKWDLENRRLMKGNMTRRLKRILDELVEEKKL